MIRCSAGDHLIKKGNVAKNMYIVLSGTLEVRADDRVVNVCSSGDIVGEMAFLLESPRSADVFVATDDTCVLSLSESNLKTLIADEPTLAAKLLLNVSKLLSYKILRRL
jgi:CRP-like cAMP-binding protein